MPKPSPSWGLVWDGFGVGPCRLLTGIFISRIGPPNHGHSTKMIFVETPTLSSSRSPWQRKNGASVHRTAKEFAVDSLACPRVVSISNSTLKGQTRGMLGKRRCGQPLSVDLDHRVSELVARADRQLLSACNNNIMSTSRRGNGRGGVFAG